jgi:hypothetical protein
MGTIARRRPALIDSGQSVLCNRELVADRMATWRADDLIFILIYNWPAGD